MKPALPLACAFLAAAACDCGGGTDAVFWVGVRGEPRVTTFDVSGRPMGLVVGPPAPVIA